MSELLDRITIEERKRGGKPCIRGMRLRLQEILEVLAGMNNEANLAAF